MEIAIAVIVLVVALLILGASPLARRAGDVKVDEMQRGRADADAQFRRPPNEGDLL
jgi:hypothetical protein